MQVDNVEYYVYYHRTSYFSNVKVDRRWVETLWRFIAHKEDGLANFRCVDLGPFKDENVEFPHTSAILSLDWDHMLPFDHFVKSDDE